VTAVEKVLRKVRRLWLLERWVPGGLLLAAVALDAGLLCLLLHRLAGLPLGSLAVVALAAAAAAAALAGLLRAAAPTPERLAQLLDDRAGSEDLFASALEFHRRPERFGWLGELTCRQARERIAAVALRPRWAFGSARRWVAAGAAAAVLCAAYGGVAALEGLRGRDGGRREVVARAPSDSRPGAGRRDEGPDQPAERPGPALEPIEPIEPVKGEDDTVEITTEMIDRYLEQLPAQQEIDLTGVTPIRWDEGEITGKDNPQNRDRDDEKIDPVKLDADLLKDLQAAKKTKDPDAGEKGGVDVAVVAKPASGAKAKGRKGGKHKPGSLSEAVSKDPRGKPVRMAVRPARKGLQIRSAARAPSRQKGEIRPMGLLEFLAAMRRAEAGTDAGPLAVPKPARPDDDRAVRLEALPEDAAGVAESYFGRLRKADR